MAIVGRAAPLSLLVIRLSAMGDVAMTVPVLALLRRQYPEIKITVLTTKFLQPFFREATGISIRPATSLPRKSCRTAFSFLRRSTRR